MLNKTPGAPSDTLYTFATPYCIFTLFATNMQVKSFDQSHQVHRPAHAHSRFRRHAPDPSSTRQTETIFLGITKHYRESRTCSSRQVRNLRSFYSASFGWMNGKDLRNRGPWLSFQDVFNAVFGHIAWWPGDRRLLGISG